MRTKIIYIYMCSIIIEFVFSNNFNNEEIFINDRRQKISSLNSLVIVNFEKNFLNDSKKINTFKKVIEYNVQQSKFFKLVNTTINEKDLKKHFNPIHGSKLSKTKKSKLKRQLNKKNIKNSIDVIFQIFSKNGKDLYLTIINTNNKELVRSSLNLKTNIFDINEEQLNAKVNILFKEILDNYFYRSVIISDRKNIDKYTIHINGNKSLPNLNIINNISRYNDVNIYFSNKDSISEKIYLKKANFILNNKNTKISQNVKQNFIEKKMPKFRPKKATIQLILKDVKSNLINKTEADIKLFKINNYYNFNKIIDSTYISDDIEINLNKVGPHFLSINVAGFSKKNNYLIIKDDIETGFDQNPPVYNGIPYNKEIMILKKSKPLTYCFSAMLPGAGQIYQNESPILYGSVMLLYSILLYKTFESYDDFHKSRENYRYWQNEYSLLDPLIDSPTTYYEYENYAYENYDLANLNKIQYQLFALSTLTVNLLNQLQLMYTDIWK